MELYDFLFFFAEKNLLSKFFKNAEKVSMESTWKNIYKTGRLIMRLMALLCGIKVKKVLIFGMKLKKSGKIMLTNEPFYSLHGDTLHICACVLIGFSWLILLIALD